MTLNCDLEKTITQNQNEEENMKDGNLFERVHLNINKTNLATLEKKLQFNKYTVTCIS